MKREKGKKGKTRYNTFNNFIDPPLPTRGLLLEIVNPF